MDKGTVIYVDVNGSGRADGTAQRPFATLEAARDALRRMRRSGKVAGAVNVRVAAGVYRLTRPLVFEPQDGGSAAAPVTWSGVGGRPVISGGRAIGGWQEATINGRPCWQTTIADVAAGQWWFTQLFVNGRRRLRARLPHSGFFRFAGVPEDEAKRDPGGYFHGAMSALYQPGDVRAFRNLDDIEVVVPDHWYESHLRLAAVDEANHTLHFATKGYSRFSRDETGRHTRYRFDNVAEGCLEPGDWYLERQSGVLSYIPMPGETIARTLFEAPLLSHLLEVRGDPLEEKKRVRHLNFEFLDFRHAEWEHPRENAGSLQASFHVPGAVRLIGAEYCAVYACHVSQVAGWGVEVMRGCHGNRIVGCALFDLGGGGVKVAHEAGLPQGGIDGSHGAFRGMDVEALGWGPAREDKRSQKAIAKGVKPSATTVSDCTIHDGGKLFHSAIGVWVGDAARNRVLHNDIWNFNYSGISCGWTWGYAPARTYDNRIEGNRIHGIGHGMLSDMGAIYTLGRQAGSTIRRNFIFDVQSYGYGGWGIYTDEGSSWMVIEDNVVSGTKSGGFHQHYGRDNIIRRNVFAAAVEAQVNISRCELARAITLENNLVHGSGSGEMIRGAGAWRTRFTRNVYAADIGRPATFLDKPWEQWQALGNDKASKRIDALLLDASGFTPTAGNVAALKAAGIAPALVAAVMAEAGPRFRGGLPAAIAAIKPVREAKRAIVEPLLWPWEAEWPDAATPKRPWAQMPGSANVKKGEPQTLSLTLENRGDATARVAYKLRVVPAGAARLTGATALSAALAPQQRRAFEWSLIPTGRAAQFWVEASASGAPATALHFTITD